MSGPEHEEVRRLDAQLPRKGGAPEAPPLPEVKLIWDKKERSGGGWWRYLGVALLAGAVGAAAMWGWG